MIGSIATASSSAPQRVGPSVAESPEPLWREPRSFAPDGTIGDNRELVRWRLRRRRGQVLYQEGEPATTFYEVVSGCIRLVLYANDGRRQIVGFCFPGDVFGFSLRARDCTAEASSDVELWAYSSAALLRASHGKAEHLIDVADRCLGHYRTFAQHVLHVRNLPAAERIAACLDAFSARLAPSDVPCRLPLSQIELSDFLGLSPETTSREVRKLCAAGRLARTGRKLLLLPPSSKRSAAASWSPASSGERPIC